ncbi:MAG: M23 family metallopeptidase [Paracoccaceae bacterium]
MRPGLAALALCAAALPAAAEPPSLALPLDCQLGETCFVEDFVDHDPAAEKSRDFACGLNTRDGHKGTDFALLSFDSIDQGVPVRAAAPGRVKAIRDEMPDDRLMRGVTSQTACGNAVLLDHGDGWQTLYCHLRLGSVAVRPGDTVETGARLGLVGLSGQTTHPHLHLTVLQDGKTVDPFRPDAALDSCGPPDPAHTLWTDPPAYHDTLLRLAGFSDRAPGYDDLRAGTARRDTLPPDAALVVYAEAGLAQPGDSLTISAKGPDGDELFRQTRTFDAPQERTARLRPQGPRRRLAPGRVSRRGPSHPPGPGHRPPLCPCHSDGALKARSRARPDRSPNRDARGRRGGTRPADTGTTPDRVGAARARLLKRVSLKRSG